MNLRNKRLTSSEITEALTLFATQQELVSDELSETDLIIINDWIYKIKLLNPAASLRPDALNAITDSIFTNIAISDFVFDLTFRFFSLAGSCENFIDKLCQNLSDGLCIDGPNLKYSLIPQELLKSMSVSIWPGTIISSYKKWLFQLLSIETDLLSVKDLLMNNKHLIIVFLINLTNTNKTV